MKSKVLIRKLFKMFPTKIAKKYHDFVGKMTVPLKEETNKVLICLDVSKAVCDYAIKNDVDLIISHHPFIYGKKKYVLLDPLKNQLYNELVNHNIPVYSFHTNFDEGIGGMNDALANALNLIMIDEINNCPLGRCGYLIEEMDVYDFAKYALKCLNIDYGQLIAEGNKLISKVGIIGGAGSREYHYAYEDGCDIYISGDTPYHIRREIIDKKLNYLHLDHEIEKIFITRMKDIISNIDSSLEIIEFDDVKQPSLIIK